MAQTTHLVHLTINRWHFSVFSADVLLGKNGEGAKCIGRMYHIFLCDHVSLSLYDA